MEEYKAIIGRNVYLILLGIWNNSDLQGRRFCPVDQTVDRPDFFLTQQTARPGHLLPEWAVQF